MSKATQSLVLRSWSGLDELASSVPFWRELLEDANLDPLCNAPEWTLAYARAFVPNDEVFGWRVETDDGTPIAFLAFRIEPSRGALALRRAVFLADGTFDSDYLDLCIRPGFERPVVELVLQALGRSPRVQAAVFSGMTDDSRTLAALRAALATRWLPKRERPAVCLESHLPATFDEYLAGLKPRMRTKIRQTMRRAVEKGVTLVRCEDPADLELHLNGLFELHQKRWIPSGGEGSFVDQRRRDFYKQVSRDALQRRKLRLYRLDWNGHAIAYQIGMVCGDIYYQMQEGFDPAHKELRPGIALRAFAIERLIGQGVHCYDFMNGDSRGKRDWGAIVRHCTTVAFALPRLRARIAYGLRALLDRNAGPVDREEVGARI